MDAFAITAVSTDQLWFRVEGVIGGDVTPARVYPRLHVMSAEELDALRASGRKLYFGQPDPGAPLVPLAPKPAFDPCSVPVEDLPRFAFLDHASDEDVDALLAVRMGQDLRPFGLRLKRLEALDWIVHTGRGVEVSPVGLELLRLWLGTSPAPRERVRTTPAAWRPRVEGRVRERELAGR